MFEPGPGGLGAAGDNRDDREDTEDGYCSAKTARIAVLIDEANGAGTSGVGSCRHIASVRFSDSQACGCGAVVSRSMSGSSGKKNLQL